jgi:hypothetical protein
MISAVQAIDDLRARGWATLALGRQDQSSLSRELVRIASGVGKFITRRDGGFIEHLSPQAATAARPSSLSMKFGTGALPLHCDTAHWIVPCRYVALACAVPGSIDAPTVLLDTHDIEFSNEQYTLARSACFIVRNGRRSFYASLIDCNRSFVRVDPGCMEPVTEESAKAIELYGYERNRSKTVAFHWHPGDLLIIDNWRVLHGRGNEVTADLSRRLLRVYLQ